MSPNHVTSIAWYNTKVPELPIGLGNEAKRLQKFKSSEPDKQLRVEVECSRNSTLAKIWQVDHNVFVERGKSITRHIGLTNVDSIQSMYAAFANFFLDVVSANQL